MTLAHGTGRRLHLDLPGVRDSVPAGRRRIVAFAAEHGATHAARRDIELACSEVLSNAVLHAYRDREPGRLRVSAEVTKDRMIEILVADAGHGIRPGAPSDGLGLGLGLVAKVAVEFEILEPEAGGTEVRMRFALDA